MASPSSDEELDTILWKPSSNGSFSIKSLKLSLTTANIQPNRPDMELIWFFLIPKKCKFFIWSLFHKGINIIDRCQSRSPAMALNPNCVFSVRLIMKLWSISLPLVYTLNRFGGTSTNLWTDLLRFLSPWMRCLKSFVAQTSLKKKYPPSKSDWCYPLEHMAGEE
ncbi:unnamed protein product [Citrullus colocynthis]|uniref:Reverse transcriptase zinc-binding domain-containing protein n=1 Tax=Citrullus colocynthis TaxID=252529 RepID=A0ABP0Y9X4_9ROSI